MSELFDPQKLVTIAENQQKVYDAGFAAGLKSGIPMVTGTAISDDRTHIIIPSPGFEANLIVIWNVAKEIQDDDVPYLYSGFMLVAKKIDGEWISQGLGGSSGVTYISNASATRGTGENFPQEPGTCVDERSDGSYLYQLDLIGQIDMEYNGTFPSPDLAGIEVNYAIYG